MTHLASALLSSSALREVFRLNCHAVYNLLPAHLSH